MWLISGEGTLTWAEIASGKQRQGNGTSCDNKQGDGAKNYQGGHEIFIPALLPFSGKEICEPGQTQTSPPFFVPHPDIKNAAPPDMRWDLVKDA